MSKKVILVCRECLSRNYTIMVSPNRQQKLEIKKYCKHCGKHTEHVETR